MTSIRSRLLVTLGALVVASCALAGTLTYRRVLAETSTLFDYQLREMALSLRSQASLAPRIEIPTQQAGADFVIEIWDDLGTRVYQSRPGLPLIERASVGYETLLLDGQRWRVYGLQTLEGDIQVAQPLAVRAHLAQVAAIRIVVPLLLVLASIFALAAVWMVRATVRPLRRAVIDVQQRDIRSLIPLSTAALPQEIRPLIEELNRLLARLDAAFAAQRAFIADAAHELRSPLTALRLQLQLLDRAGDEAARHAARAELGAAVDRATHLIQQLLTLARNEPGAGDADERDISLEVPAAEAIADTHAFAESRRITLSLEAAPSAPVRGSPEALRTLVRNLVDNAVRYSPAGGHVEVRVRPGAAQTLLEVLDEGPGIASAQEPRIFDRFYRRAGTTQEGTGLGLAIVKAIADRHGAQISLGSSPAGGLRIAVAFPAAAAHKPALRLQDHSP